MVRIRSFWIALLGNLLEHYDTALFALLAPFLAPLFFPSESPTLSLLMTYALLPLGMIAKPLGAVVFGWMGDRFGRKKILSVCLIGMACATGAIGFLPTYEQVGPLASVLLGLGRSAQSFFAAGETTGGAIYILDKLPPSERSFASSLFDASGILGILLGSAIVSVWSEGWRWMFWAGTLTGIVGALLRLDRTETAKPALEMPWKTLWKERSALLAIVFVSGFSYFNYNLITTFMNGFLPLVSSLTKEESMKLNTLLLCFDLALLPMFGWIAKKWTKEKVMAGAALAILVLAVPLFLLLDGAGVGTAAFVRLTLTFLGVALAAPFHAWAYERAPENHRFLISAVGIAIGSRMLGAPAPVLGIWLYHKTGWIAASVLPLILIGVCAVGCLYKIQSRKNLEGTTRKALSGNKL